MRCEKRLVKAFGQQEEGLADLPRKRSGTALARVALGAEIPCTWCFPHGYESPNSRASKLQRCWKRQRKTQWKAVAAATVPAPTWPARAAPPVWTKDAAAR